jgi:hypothetical protein
MPGDVPIIPVVVSVAATVWEPGVSSKTLTEAVPPDSKVGGGRLAAASLLEKPTVPVYPLATLPAASTAVTLTVAGEPA